MTQEDRAIVTLFTDAQARVAERGSNYNAGNIQREDYNVFPLKSWGMEVHKEALRICSWIEQDNPEKVREHLVDLVVYASFLYEECYLHSIKKRQEESGQ